MEPTHQVHGPQRTLDAFGEMTLMQSLLDRPNAYLDELQLELQAHTGVHVSLSTIYRTLQRLGFTRKKLRYVVLKRSEVDRATCMEEMEYINAEMIVWIDESGSDRRDSIRRYGYHLRGLTPVSYNLGPQGKRLSVTTALSTRGI